MSAPALPDSVIERPRLARRLDERWHRRLVTVVGGPGFGKTTALSMQTAVRPSPSDIDVWLTCAAGDSEDVVLLGDLSAAFSLPRSASLDDIVAQVWMRAPHQYRDSTRGAEAWTNVDTGRSYSTEFTVNSIDRTVTDNGDGTLSIVVQGSGGSRWYDGDGTLVLRDPGMTRWEILIHHGGTPNDPFDDEFLAFVGIVRESTGLNETHDRVRSPAPVGP